MNKDLRRKASVILMSGGGPLRKQEKPPPKPSGGKTPERFQRGERWMRRWEMGSGGSHGGGALSGRKAMLCTEGIFRKPGSTFWYYCDWGGSKIYVKSIVMFGIVPPNKVFPPFCVPLKYSAAHSCRCRSLFMLTSKFHSWQARVLGSTLFLENK